MTKFGEIALIGRPNAGKSTLLNYLLGRKISIVSDKPQTTRHRILGVLTKDDYQLVFVDLPGFHKPMYEMNKVMMQNVYSELDTADVILYIIDASVPIGNGERFLMNTLKDVDKPKIVALNKIDIIKKSRVLPLIEELKEMGFEEIVPISASAGINVDQLLEVILKYVPEGEFQYDVEYITNINERVYIAEIVREKILKETRDELPYTTFVEVRKIEHFDDYVEIFCDIIVEKKSQKPILIGKGGNMIKKIRKESEAELREYFGKEVSLELFVRVEKMWRQKGKYLQQFNI